MKPIAACALALSLSAALSAGPTAHLRGPDGKWSEAPVRQERGKIIVKISPAQTDQGKALLVINKPPWMVLEDAAPPVIEEVTLNGRAPRETDGALDFGSLEAGPQKLRVRLRDELNPVDPRTIRLLLDGRPVSIPARAGAPAKMDQQLDYSLALPALTNVIGRHTLQISAADASPAQNRVAREFSYTIFGAQISEDRQQIHLATGGSDYLVNAQDESFLTIPRTACRLYLTAQRKPFCWVNEFDEVSLLHDDPDRKVVRAKARAYDRKQKAYDPDVALEFDFEVRNDSPALFITSRVINQGPKHTIYSFWGWLPGADFQVAGEDEPRAWAMQYKNVGKYDWLYLSPIKAGQRGLGVVTPQVIGESRFGTMLFYTDPSKIEVAQGGGVEMKLAIFPAESAEEVALISQSLAKP